MLEQPKERVLALHKQAEAAPIHNSVPIKMYMRSGLELIRMGGVYMDEKNYEKAFILYTKFAILALQKLPTHPGYASLDGEEIKATKKRAKKALDIAEEVKKKLLIKYETEYKMYEEHLWERLEKERASEELAKNMQIEESRSEAERLQQDYERRLAKIKEEERLRAISEAGIGDPKQPPVDRKSVGGGSATTTIAATVNQTDHMLPFNRNFSLSLSSPLRKVAIPHILQQKFASLAQSNTDRNIETCGIICGKMSRDQFTVTHVVLLKQSGTSDSCLTTDEEELFGVLERDDVITLGWIHTHPSQSAFLSSVDLHTQFGYQSMLPEAVAIVLAPRYKQYQSFSITEEGLNVLGNCHETGFHYHNKEPPLHKVSQHVVIDSNLPLKTVDLRHK